VNGKRIKALRLRLGLSREEFAERLGVTRIAVWRWEEAKGSAKRKPSRLATRAIQQFERQETVATNRVYRGKPIGGPGSVARSEQEDRMQAEDALIAAIVAVEEVTK
jgi:transcriptional regulator with XRE-family HTH domain